MTKETRQDWHVTYYYLATGMDGNADTRDYGIVVAFSAEEARDTIAESEYKPGTDEYEFFRGCLSARTMTDSGDYKEVDTASFMAQSKKASMIDHENSLILDYTELMLEKHALMKLKNETNQRIYKLEENMAYCHREIQECQRVRLTAANAEASLKSTLIDETGLTEEQIEKALTLIRDEKADIGQENKKISDN